MDNNKSVYIKYVSAKGRVTERLVTDIKTEFTRANGKDMWVLRCICCKLNISLVIPLIGVSFI